MTDHKHFATTDYMETLCTKTGQDEVYGDGTTITTGPQPHSYCTACHEGEPEWTYVEDHEMQALLQQIF